MQSNGTLACDPFENSPDDHSEFVASVCRSESPIARNSLVLQRVSSNERPESRGDPGDSSNVVRWGQSFQIMCYPSLVESATQMKARRAKPTCGGDSAGPKPLFLASRRTALSCRQLIHLTHDGSSYDTHWVAHIPAKSKNAGLDRFVNEGAPIILGEPFVLQHCATKQLLSADRDCPIITDFGSEFEVSVCAGCTPGRVGVLRDEFQGAKTSATNCRPELVQNVWCAAVLPQSKNLTSEHAICPEGILSKVWDMLRHQGYLSFRRLRTYLFSAVAENGGNALGTNMVHWIFSECGLRLDEGQFKALIELVSGEVTPNKHMVDVSALCHTLRGPIQDARQQIIDDTLANLGSVDGDTLASAWDALCRSDVLVKNIGGEIDSFFVLWNWSDKGTISKEGKFHPGRNKLSFATRSKSIKLEVLILIAFFDFHADLSAEVQDDAVFRGVMNILWGK
mmetsp:Transcript_36076/g.107892  ORF Transcript_36076/g.107892 Transcript_36076/m.107892 type:complete len:453 (-) Transcript_36076:260-1618(-)